jgi:hypothetical protein
VPSITVAPAKRRRDSNGFEYVRAPEPTPAPTAVSW